MDAFRAVDLPEIDLDFEPQQRSRCNTWPAALICSPGGELSPPNAAAAQTADEAGVASFPHTTLDSLIEDEGDGPLCGDGVEAQLVESMHESPMTAVPQQDWCMDDADGGDEGVPAKKGAIRRNPWGPMSYADLITKAIQSSPDQKLTLSQVYDWFCKNVPYFSDKSETNSSAGWKVRASVANGERVTALARMSSCLRCAALPVTSCCPSFLFP